MILRVLALNGFSLKTPIKIGFWCVVVLRGTGPRATVSRGLLGVDIGFGASLFCEGQALALRYRGGLLGS